ncbi:hypothetical protein BC828DRAFT_384874 [Blastocladiella britannica]|nr:hypothetical protein BC828DRAFT_384874 [Blastocladiella britannica]
MARLLVQVGLLLRKYALILSRSPFQLILGLISPLAALLLSVVSSGAMTNSYQIMFTGTATSVSMTDPKPLPVAYPVCAAGSSTVACQRPRILYAPNDAYHAAVVAQLASDIGLSTGAPDVIAYPTLDALAADLVTRRSAIVKERPINFGVSFTTFASVGTIAGFSTGSVPLIQ